MNPFFPSWSFAPQIHFPWSGGVMQSIDPSISWFGQMIKPGAGNPQIEKQAFDVASYGKQLGLLTEIVLALADQAKLAAVPKSVQDLKEIQRRIEEIKQAELAGVNDLIVAHLKAARERGGADLAQLKERLMAALALPAPVAPVK